MGNLKLWGRNAWLGQHHQGGQGGWPRVRVPGRDEQWRVLITDVAWFEKKEREG